MLTLNAVGYITKAPALAQSAKGTSYLKFTVEVPASGGRYPTRLAVTAFGQQATRLSAQLGLGQLVAVVGEPQWRGYQDNAGKARSAPEVIAREVTVLAGSAPSQVDDLPAQTSGDVFEEDVPF